MGEGERFVPCFLSPSPQASTKLAIITGPLDHETGPNQPITNTWPTNLPQIYQLNTSNSIPAVYSTSARARISRPATSRTPQAPTQTGTRKRPPSYPLDK